MSCRPSGAIGLLGPVADAVGIAATMQVVCLLPLPGALLSLALPDTRGAPQCRCVRSICVTLLTGRRSIVAEPRGGRWNGIRARRLADPAAGERYERTRRTVAAIRETLMRVDQARARAGLTKAELARRVGANPATVRRLLSSGQHNPTLKTVLEVCDALGMEVTVAPKREGVTVSRTQPRTTAAG